MTDLLSLEDALATLDEMGLVVADPGLLASALVRSATIVFGEDAYPDLATKVTEGSTILSELSDWFAARATTVPTH